MEREYIGKIKETAKIGRKSYSENLEQILKQEIVELRDTLKQCVSEHAKEEEFGLIISNDASSKIELYEMVDRVKSPESLEEKIIRNQEFFDLMDKDGKELIKAIQEKNDDLMGLRFLVSLSCDCKRLFDLLVKYHKELELKDITFLNLGENPQTMRNGRSIYKIKGKYKTKYPFELQIKSKVDSAWADIEHMLFYKDYQFSYIQSTNKQVMKKLGDLLDQVDELMIQVRESQASYEKDRKEMEFTQYLGSKFRNQIHKIVGSAFVLSDYRRVLFYIFSQFESAQQQIILNQNNEVIAENFYVLGAGDTDSTFVKNYNHLVEHSLEFVISEHIYAEWLNNIKKLNDGGDKVEKLKDYFKLLIEGLLQEKMEYYLGNNNVKNEFIKWGVQTILNSLENREISFDFPIFLVNPEEMYMMYSFYKANTNAAANMLSSDDITAEGAAKEINDSIENINNEVIVYLFENNIKNSSKNIIDVLKECEELKEYYSAEFVEKIKEEYGKVKKTVSGKDMPDNVLSKLFEKVLHLSQEDDDNE